MNKAVGAEIVQGWRSNVEEVSMVMVGFWAPLYVYQSREAYMKRSIGSLCVMDFGRQGSLRWLALKCL